VRRGILVVNENAISRFINQKMFLRKKQE
jgi:hypothetical protein